MNVLKSLKSFVSEHNILVKYIGLPKAIVRCSYLINLLEGYLHEALLRKFLYNAKIFDEFDVLSIEKINLLDQTPYVHYKLWGDVNFDLEIILNNSEKIEIMTQHSVKLNKDEFKECFKEMPW